MKKLRTCVAPTGRFVVGHHKPHFRVENLRKSAEISSLGQVNGNQNIENIDNFPKGPIAEPQADHIFEIANPFPFRGTTYIIKSIADKHACNPESIALPEPAAVSLSAVLKDWSHLQHLSSSSIDELITRLPEPLKLALAATSTDPDDLIRLADLSCEFIYDSQTNQPSGVSFTSEQGQPPKPVIHNRALFETLANNVFMPDSYKEVMVLRPGIQGSSEIVGEWTDKEKGSHVYEYLRRNSYIPWGHYAANMANDAVRYRIKDLTFADMTGMRHLYYQRVYIQLADQLEINFKHHHQPLTSIQLEDLRLQLCEKFKPNDRPPRLRFNRTLWGWNFGFDFSPSKYRLHASHQQIHQQYALIPSTVDTVNSDGPVSSDLGSYACGDLIEAFIHSYKRATGRGFFDTYLNAIDANQRVDGRTDLSDSLMVHQDQHVLVFVPKAQTSQWEIQLIAKQSVGNILEADPLQRQALDRAILITMKILEALGARMVTVIEYSKRFDTADTEQRLLYAFLPRLPQSPGAFSEAQLRWINGHYPEDFAAACRRRLPHIWPESSP